MPVTRVSGLPLPAPAFTPPFFATAVSSNGRYLVDQYGQPFLVKADTPWDAADNINSTDQTTYLSDRHSKGFNSIMCDLIGSTTMTGRVDTNWNGEQPFSNPATFALNNTYWNRIDTFLQLCQTYAISAFILPIDAYAWEGTQANMAQSDMQTFGTTLANRWPQASYPGLVWTFGNDWIGAGGGANVNTNPSTGLYEAFLTGVRSTGDTRPTVAENGFYESQLGDCTDAGFKNVMTINGLYSYHPTYEVSLRGFAASPTKPCLFLEGEYENATDGNGTPITIRKQVGWNMTSGGAGNFYGNESLWKFPTGWQTQLTTTIVSHYITMLNAFAGIKWWTLSPDTGNLLVTAGRNTQWTSGPASNTIPPNNADTTYGWYVTASYSADGKTAAIYNPSTTLNSITISSSVLAANPQITRVDPTNGATTSLGFTTTPTGGTNAGGDNDWLFLISAG